MKNQLANNDSIEENTEEDEHVVNNVSGKLKSYNDNFDVEDKAKDVRIGYAIFYCCMQMEFVIYFQNPRQMHSCSESNDIFTYVLKGVNNGILSTGLLF